MVAKTNSTPQKKTKWMRLALLFGSAILATSLCVLWMIFQHKPTWYQPANMNEQSLARAQYAITTFIDDTSHKMVKGKPFDITLTQQQVNQWLGALPELFPQTRQELPDWLRESAVSFSTDLLRIGVRYDKNGWRAILNASLTLSISENTDDLVLALQDVHGGSMPIPRWTLEKMLGDVIAQPQRRNTSSAASILSQAQSVDDVFTGLNIENNFLWPNGKRRYRIVSISIRDEVIKLRIDPQRR